MPIESAAVGALSVYPAVEAGAGGSAVAAAGVAWAGVPVSPGLAFGAAGVEYGLVGKSGRAPMGARPGAHDDTVMGLALAVFAAPEGAPARPLPSRSAQLYCP